MSNAGAGFQDHFSGHAGAYAAHRPAYPAELFEWLAGQAPGHALAWDCATGSGQSAVALATHFERVVASDASAAQIENAASHSRVEYRVEPAERGSLEPDSVDLIAVAQAYHWFDREAFHREADRVLRKGGVLAAWGYGLTRVSPQVDALVFELYDGILGAYWPRERAFIDRAYRDFELPWTEVEAPDFAMRLDWSLEQLLGYLETWSAVQRYLAAHGSSPLADMRERFASAWGAPEKPKSVTWPLFLRAAVKN